MPNRKLVRVLPGFSSRLQRFQSTDWLAAPALGFFSDRYRDQTGDQVREIASLWGKADSARASNWKRSRPLRSFQ